MVNVEKESKLEIGKLFDTLISEEALLFAKYLRNEKKDWTQRITSLLAN